MAYPKVSILWINYNSLRNIDLVLKSLKSIKDLDYPNYELIIVDNGSTDGSYKIICDYVSKNFNSNAKIIRLNKNLGFCGGNNIAFRARDPNSKYVILLNNDAIPYPDSLKNLVEEMERDPYLGSAQGIIIDYENNYIDTAGGIMDELLFTYHLLHGLPPSFTRSTYVTYVDGAYSIHRIKAIRRVNAGDKLFHDELFAYYEDCLLGLKMWNYRYKVKTFPFIIAKHRRSSTFETFKPLKLYLLFRNYMILKEVSNSRYKNVINIHVLKRIIIDLIGFRHYKNINLILTKAYKDAKKISRKLIHQGLRIDLYRAPIIDLKPMDALKGILLRRTIAKIINKRVIRYHHIGV